MHTTSLSPLPSLSVAQSSSAVAGARRISLLGWVVVALLVAAKFWVLQGTGTGREVDPGLMDPAMTAPAVPR